MIKRTIINKDKSTILPLYKSLVRPHLDYCAPAWRPHHKKDIKVLEKVQKRATKLVTECQTLSYEERLKFLHLTTLETRFLRADLISVYKFVNNIDKIDTNLLFQYNNRISRGNKYKIFKPHAD